jgi:hypothetical protein
MKPQDPERDRRILEIMKLECEGKWDSFHTPLVIADKYGVTIKTVRQLRSEALRFIRLNAAETLDDERNRLIATTDRIAEVAMKKTRPVVIDGEIHDYPDPDCAAATGALKLRDKVLALSIARVGEDDDAKVGDEEMLERLEAATKSVRERIAGRRGLNGNGRATH